jgi:hypothetical protein
MSSEVRNPFIGLRPFQPDECDIFFGREEDAEVLFNIVVTSSLSLVYARSGVGKTSLLAAGLKPFLDADEDLHAVHVVDWKTGFHQSLQAKLGAGEQRSRFSILAHLRQFAQPVTNNGASRRMVLLLDQFEELLRYTSDHAMIWDALAEIAHAPDSPGHVVISMREDYLGLLDPLLRRARSLIENSMRVPVMKDASIQAVLQKTLERGSPRMSMDKQLPTRILADLHPKGRAAVDSPLELGLLQIVCSHLWCTAQQQGQDVITVDLYDKAGHAEGIVDKHIAVTLQTALTQSQEAIFVAACRSLITRSGAKIALSVDDLVDSIELDHFAWGHLIDHGKTIGISRAMGVKVLDTPEARRALQDTLDVLCEQRAGRILRRVEVADDRIEYQLSHDMLGRILRRWREGVILSRAGLTHKLGTKLTHFLEYTVDLILICMIIAIVLAFMYLFNDVLPRIVSPILDDLWHIPVVVVVYATMLFLGVSFGTRLVKLRHRYSRRIRGLSENDYFVTSDQIKDGVPAHHRIAFLMSFMGVWLSVTVVASVVMTVVVAVIFNITTSDQYIAGFGIGGVASALIAFRVYRFLRNKSTPYDSIYEQRALELQKHLVVISSFVAAIGLMRIVWVVSNMSVPDLDPFTIVAAIFAGFVSWIYRLRERFAKSDRSKAA